MSRPAEGSWTSWCLCGIGVILLVGLIGGIVLMSGKSKGNEGEGDEGADGGGGNGGGGDGGGSVSTGNQPYVNKGDPPPRSTAPTTTALPTTTTTTTEPTTTTTPRPVYCVIGERLVTNKTITSGFCDYVIYPDLTFVEGKFQAFHGRLSWDVFDKAVKSNQAAFKAGASFLHMHPTDGNGTVSSISEYKNQIEELVKGGYRALGFLDVPIHKGFKVDVLKDALKVFSDVLARGANISKTFLGVQMYTDEQAKTFAEDVVKITGLDTIIIEVHNAGTIGTENDCQIHAITYMGTERIPASDLRATYQRATSAMDTIRSKGFTGGVTLSSSMGAMIYDPGPKEQYIVKGFGQNCSFAILRHVGIVCDILTQPRKPNTTTKSTQFLFRGAGARTYYYVTDDQIDKWEGSTYLNASDGWAIFNVELDMYGECQKNKTAGALVDLLAKAVRSLP